GALHLVSAGYCLVARTSIAATAGTASATATPILLRLRQFARQRRATGKADLPIRGDVRHHDGDLIAKVDDILDLVDAYQRILRQFGDMDQSVASRRKLDKRAVWHDAHDLAIEDFAALGLELRLILGQLVDLLFHGIGTVCIRRSDRNGAVILEIGRAHV